MPEHYLFSLKHHIKPHWKTAFFSAILLGFLTHLYIFTNALPNHDGLLNIYSEQAKFSSGRFFLSPFAGIGSYFDLPWVNGVLAVLYLAITAVALTELFELRKKLAIVLMSGLLVAFPTVTATFSYMFTADGYMLAYMVTALSLVLTKSYKYGFVPGAFLFFLSVGVYQANLPFALTLITVFLIREALSREADIQRIGRYTLRFFLMGTIGMGLYALLFKIYTNFLSGPIADYQGLNEIGSDPPTLSESFTLINDSFQEFFFRGFITDMPVNLFEVLNVLLFGLIVSGFIYLAAYHKTYLKLPLLAIAGVLMLLLPLLAYSMYFISPEVSYHMLMVMSLLSLYLLPVVFYDAYTPTGRLSPLLSWGTLLVTAVIVFNFIIIANISYFNMNMKYEKSYGLANRIVDRIEQTEGYEGAEKLAVFGRASLDDNISTEEVSQSVPKMTGVLGNRFLAHPLHYERMFKHFFGLSLELVEEEEKDLLLESTLYQEMGVWPAEDSIFILDDTVLIKFN